MKIFHRFYEMFLWLKNNETFHRIYEEIHRYYEENSFSVHESIELMLNTHLYLKQREYCSVPLWKLFSLKLKKI